MKRNDAEHRLQCSVVHPQMRKDVEHILRRCAVVDQCWVWQGAMQHGGYGSFRLRNSRKIVRTHRFIMLALGHEIEGKVVCHRCDNPPCCNPDHLFVADQKANIRDCISKGRFVPPPVKDWADLMRHQPHHWQKLRREDIPLIRERLARGDRQKDIAGDFGVSLHAISKINRGERWAHV